MNEPPDQESVWEALFGPLRPEEREALARDLALGKRDALAEQPVHEALQKLGAEHPEPAAPAIPEGVRRRLEDARAEAFARAAARVPLAPVAPEARPVRPVQAKPSLLAWLFSGPALAVAGGVAVLLVATLLVLDRGGLVPGRERVAATLLTPGTETGFTRPTITWQMRSPGPARVVVEEAATGAGVARVEGVFSPLPFARWGGADLEPGKSYRVRVEAVVGDQEVTVSSFRVAPGAEGAPERFPDLDGVVRQCEQLLAANRPADAWMLWAELTAEERADSRMVRLREEILRRLAA